MSTLIAIRSSSGGYLQVLEAGIGIGIATSKAVEAIARQPEAESKISKLFFLDAPLRRLPLFTVLLLLCNYLILKITEKGRWEKCYS